ncbi:DUF2875 family protein, partial [Dyella sp. ASV21]|uniref:type VI lipase adapter Tla3 domain-containing protein n=1 Tax=Dyella sp. ASV21 TaxID=2795114 RepID=UPI0018EBB910
GLVVDVYRQGQVWQRLRQQDAGQPASLQLGSILPTDPATYPVIADAKDQAWQKRKADALELGLKDFLEAWPIPTLTIVRGYNPAAARLRTSPQGVNEMLSTMVNDLRQPAGLHWHEIRPMEGGGI